MTVEHSIGALAGPSSDASGNRSLVFAGSDVARTPCAGSGRMPDATGTRSGPAVGV